MTLHRFQLFVSIARQLNITKVSRQLRVSQPSVSQQLKLLQEEYGTTFFKKNGRRLALTDSGKAFLKDVEPITIRLDELKAKYLQKRAAEKIESLAIGGSYGPSARILPSVMARFKREQPNADLHLNTGDSAQIEDAVLESEVDIAVITNPYPSPLLKIEPFRKETLSLFVAANHPLAKKKKIAVEDLAVLPIVIRGERGGRNLTEDLLGKLTARGLRPRISMRCESPESVKAAVRSGAGIGILYRDAIASAVKAGALRLIELPGLQLSRPSYIVYLRENPLSPTAQQFLLLLRMARNKRRPFINQSVTTARSWLIAKAFWIAALSPALSIEC